MNISETELYSFNPKQISVKEILDSNDLIIIDVRTPKEFYEDNIPNSTNIPLFTNKEREIIGKKYKKDQIRAFDLGKEYFLKKLKTLEKKLKKIDKEKKIVIYCWRGGMRSKAFTFLFNKLGYEAYQLKGGYKKYREFVRKKLHSFKPNFKLIVLHGLTGAGKTQIIQKIKPSIDLEGLAKHRSSLFGAIGLNPNSQKMFESILYKKLLELNKEKYVFIEGESHKVGGVFIPDNIFKEMNKGIKIKINSPIKDRVERLVKEYISHNKENDEILKNIIKRVKKNFTNKEYEEMIKSINEKEYRIAAKILLEKYYDPRYKHKLDELKYDYEFNHDTLEGTSKEIIKNLKKLL